MPENSSEESDTRTILLVEDTPGDARYIREMFRDAVELSARTSTAEDGGPAKRDTSGTDSGTTIVHVERLADAIDRMAEDVIDVVLLDLDLPDSKGLETVRAVRDRSTSVPIVVLTGLRDRQVGMTALSRGADEYLVKDEITEDLLIRSVYYAIERKAQERELERQRNQLASINSLSKLVNEISDSVIESSSRDEIERLVCEHLANSDSYQFAWIGEVNAGSGTVRMRTGAGLNPPLEDLVARIDETPEGRGPTGRAVRTGEVQITHPRSPDNDPWARLARESEFRSAAAIPIAFEGTSYGVLSVYSERPQAFEEAEQSVIGRLGEVVGHAISAIERKEALMSEDVVEVRLLVEDVLGPTGVHSMAEGAITFDRVIPASDDVFLEYGTVGADAIDALEALVEHVPHFESLELIDEGETVSRFELRLTEPPVVSTIASLGGHVDSARITDGDFHISVHLPTSAEVSQVVEAVKEEFPTAAVIAQRTTTRPERSADRLEWAQRADLTDRQRSSIEAAYFGGYFDWPRDRSGEDIAESLGVAPSTFHQHLRIAQKKILGIVLDDA